MVLEQLLKWIKVGPFHFNFHMSKEEVEWKTEYVNGLGKRFDELQAFFKEKGWKGGEIKDVMFMYIIASGFTYDGQPMTKESVQDDHVTMRIADWVIDGGPERMSSLLFHFQNYILHHLYLQKQQEKQSCDSSPQESSSLEKPNSSPDS